MYAILSRTEEHDSPHGFAKYECSGYLPLVCAGPPEEAVPDLQVDMGK